jgi:hypothetical protein
MLGPSGWNSWYGNSWAAMLMYLMNIELKRVLPIYREVIKSNIIGYA